MKSEKRESKRSVVQVNVSGNSDERLMLLYFLMLSHPHCLTLFTADLLWDLSM